jgi:signal transduction histidine kinase
MNTVTDSFGGETTTYRISFAVAALLNAAASLTFFYAGRNLLGLRRRLLFRMQPSRPDPTIWVFWKAFIRSRWVLASAWVLAFTAAIAPAILVAYPTVIKTGISSERLANSIYGAAAFGGLLTLGMGLTRELTRQKREFVGLFAGLSIVVYAFVQLLVMYPPWLPITRLLALTLKAMFAIAISSYWVMIGEVARAQKERPSLAYLKSRARREIHDRCRGLESILHLIEIAQIALRNGEDESIHECLKDIDRLVVKQNREWRQILAILRTPDGLIRERGLVQALAILFDDLRRDATIPIEFEVRPGESVLNDYEEDSFYSVVRESVRNSIRHAHSATFIKVTLDCYHVWVAVEDDGCGMPEVECQGHGIEMMREWASQVDADLTFSRREPQGTMVKLEVGNGRQ